MKPAENAWSGSAPGWSRPLLWVVAALAVLQTVGILGWYWPGSLPDTDTSGVWTALADDVAHGDFYRALQGPLGTGGTRYMPLFFTLHGALIRAGLTPLAAGVGLTLGSAVLFVLALGALLRRLGVPRSIAWAGAALLTGTVSFEMMSLTIRGDFLAAAANLAGVTAALAWREKGGNLRLGMAAAFFAAAFLTKMTTLSGLAAVVGWMLWRGERAPALRLALASGALMLAGVGLAEWSSDGRMLASFRAVASGGTTLAYAATSPLRFLGNCADDPLLCLLLVPAALVLVGPPSRGLGAFSRWLTGIVLLVTLVIYGSPGTSLNHLLDLSALAVLLLVLALGHGGRWAVWSGGACALLGVGIVATWLPGVPSIPAFHRHYGVPRADAPREFAQRAGPGVSPILAENPLIPILAGERPYVGDLFNLLLMMERDPEQRRAFIERLAQGKFGGIVISNWPDVFPRDVDGPQDPLIAERWPELRQHGRIFDDFYDVVARRYRIVLVRRPYIYFLRDDLGFAPPR